MNAMKHIFLFFAAVFLAATSEAQPPPYTVILMEFDISVWQDDLGRGSDGLVYAIQDSAGWEYMLLIESDDSAALDFSGEVLPDGWYRYPPANRPTFTGGPVAGSVAKFVFDGNGNMYLSERRFVGIQ